MIENLAGDFYISSDFSRSNDNENKENENINKIRMKNIQKMGVVECYNKYSSSKFY